MNKINLEMASNGDSDFLFYLRNLPETYENSRNARPVNKEEHKNWLLSIIKNKEIFLYVIYCDDNKAGQIRFDKMDEFIVEVSISVLKDYWGKKVAETALIKGIKEMRGKGMERVIAEIKRENFRSIKFFEKNGFTKFRENSEFFDLEYILKQPSSL
ncbi:hypothetical protein COU58_02525 [Candidatus Pacearchaeota archaeon CG10_big_fil_rev_8_21_14_0_10_32_42]|nr:MAG: hypothetical protein COU58_02525 [Candidatus Pacearchaeota archaeon CG10_big_fil_rev_8_21_14_0_10_32_42]